MTHKEWINKTFGIYQSFERNKISKSEFKREIYKINREYFEAKKVKWNKKKNKQENS